MNLVKTFITLFWVLFCLFELSAETRHIHLLKILDSENSDYIIREACRTIDQTMDKEVQLMKQYLGVLTIHHHEISGAGFTKDELLKQVDYELSYLEGDIVILVYVGHGFRSPGMKSVAPMLYLNSYDESVSFLDIQQVILDKRPSLLMSIVLACNKTQTVFNEPPGIIAVNEPDASSDLQYLFPRGITPVKYKELFKEIPNQTKCIDLFGADKEYYTFISQNGGIFFNETLMVLHEAFAESNFSSWNEICKAIEDRTVLKLNKRSITAQKPYCNYYQSLFPLEIGENGRKILDKHYLKKELKALKRKQKEQLKALRRTHRQIMRTAKRNKKSKKERKVVAFQHRSELEQMKAKHQNDLFRLAKQ